MSSLPSEVRDVFGRFITCEYTTVDARGRPITWPVTPYYSEEADTVDVTTGVGYPKKAVDARRNPQVSLLFSDPTGSGIDSGIAVLVQGPAAVDDDDLAANKERYERESLAKLPAAQSMLPPKAVRGLFGWYFERIYVKVRPERVFVWTDGDLAKTPLLHDARREEVRSGHNEEPEREHAGTSGGSLDWDRRIAELGQRYETGVLSWLAPDGFPLSVRVPVSVDGSSKRVRIGGEPAGLPLLPGPACLTAHSHAPDFAWQENFQVRGDLARDDEGWCLVPHRLIGGFEVPDESTMARNRRNLGKAIRFYKTRKSYLRERD